MVSGVLLVAAFAAVAAACGLAARRLYHVSRPGSAVEPDG
jgi:hypothetical protein